MNTLNFWLNGLLSILDLKQYLFTGSENSNSLTQNEVRFSRRLYDTSEDYLPVKYFTNPLILRNTPDPGVSPLADGSGWVMVATSNKASSSGNTSAFPIYFSKGIMMISCIKVTDQKQCIRFGFLAFPLLGFYFSELASLGEG